MLAAGLCTISVFPRICSAFIVQERQYSFPSTILFLSIQSHPSRHRSRCRRRSLADVGILLSAGDRATRSSRGFGDSITNNATIRATMPDKKQLQENNIYMRALPISSPSPPPLLWVRRPSDRTARVMAVIRELIGRSPLDEGLPPGQQLGLACGRRRRTEASQ